MSLQLAFFEAYYYNSWLPTKILLNTYEDDLSLAADLYKYVYFIVAPLLYPDVRPHLSYSSSSSCHLPLLNSTASAVVDGEQQQHVRRRGARGLGDGELQLQRAAWAVASSSSNTWSRNSLRRSTTDVQHVVSGAGD